MTPHGSAAGRLAAAAGLVLLISGCTTAPEVSETASAAFDAGPTLVSPDVVSTGLNERDATLMPDRSEMYFTLWTGSAGVILFSRRDGDGWGEPRVAPFSGRFSDLEPMIAPDGQSLYFASSRPLGDEADPGDYNIWVVSREADSWGRPVLVTEPVSQEGDEFYPSITASGELYFTSSRDGGQGGEDIWRAIPSPDSGFAYAEAVPGGVNTERDEFNAFVAPDGSYLVFSSWGREDGLGGGDLYVSFDEGGGTFGPGINMGEPINSGSLDYSPSVGPGGEDLYFSSRRTTYSRGAEGWTYPQLRAALSSPGNGAGDIFRVSATVLDSLRKAK